VGCDQLALEGGKQVVRVGGRGGRRVRVQEVGGGLQWRQPDGFTRAGRNQSRRHSPSVSRERCVHASLVKSAVL